MRNANEKTVETAVQQILRDAPPTQMNELLSIMAIFSEPLMTRERLIALVGKERIMESEIVNWAVEQILPEKVQAAVQAAVQETESKLRAEIEAQLRQQECQNLMQSVEDTLLLRFPDAPVMLLRDLRQVQQRDALRSLILAIQQAPDIAAVQQLFRQAAQAE